MKIVELAEIACSQIKQIDILVSDKQNADDIEATYKTLKDTLKLAREINKSCLLFQKRLNIQEFQQYELAKILKEVRDLQSKFSSGQERRQVQGLQQTIYTPLTKLHTKITNEWKKDVDRRLKPHFELLNVVRLLPEIREKEAKINGWKEHLQHYREVMPTSQNELDDFDLCVTQIETHLAHLENLHEDVLKFLQKIYDNKATMADVTDEVLRWCHRGEHANIFHVSFTD